jgi:hypothetical protein
LAKHHFRESASLLAPYSGLSKVTRAPPAFKPQLPSSLFNGKQGRHQRQNHRSAILFAIAQLDAKIY